MNDISQSYTYFWNYLELPTPVILTSKLKCINSGMLCLSHYGLVLVSVGSETKCALAGLPPASVETALILDHFVLCADSALVGTLIALYVCAIYFDF